MTGTGMGRWDGARSWSAPESLRVWMVLALGVLLAGCFGGGSEEGAVRRGDQAFARGDLPEALAEYRLGLRQGNRSTELLIRAAHAYARSGRITDARDHYREAIEQDPEIADLAAADLLRVASAAVARNDGIAASAAVEAAMQLKPGVSLVGAALPLARHFARNGQFGQALPFFEKAVQESRQEAAVIFEMALAYEELDDCERALFFFEQVRGQLPVARRSEVDWHVGNCSAELAEEARERGDLEEALQMYQNTISLGEPRSRVAPAWFEIGEILSQRGECAAALRAFENVLREDQVSGLLMDRARDRIDDIRFRRTADEPC